MPTYTAKLSTLIQEDFDFGLTDYPIFDEAYREGLNKKILDHYWNYEIGQETESMFRFSLNRKMREIMPLYNQRYLSTQIEFDPLQTVNYSDLANNTHTGLGTATNTQENVTDTTGLNTETTDVDATNTKDGTESGEGDSTSTTLGRSRSVSSTTPQVQLSGDEDYAANAADVNSDSAVTGNSTNSGISHSTDVIDSTSSSTQDITSNETSNLVSNSSRTDDGTDTLDREVKGSQGPASELIMLYRATFLNIDMEIIDELKSLFMQVWDNGDEFTCNNLSNWSFGYGFGLL